MTADFRTCVVDDDGLWCYDKSLETQPELVGLKSITLGYEHACALDDSGIQCWGGNLAGLTPVIQE